MAMASWTTSSRGFVEGILCLDMRLGGDGYRMDVCLGNGA